MKNILYTLTLCLFAGIAFSQDAATAAPAIPSWPKEPIMPGETSEIEIHYATDRIGVIMKTVTVTTNEEGVSHVIQVKGNVKVKPAEESVPAKQASLLSPAKKSGPVNQ